MLVFTKVLVMLNSRLRQRKFGKKEQESKSGQELKNCPRMNLKSTNINMLKKKIQAWTSLNP